MKIDSYGLVSLSSDEIFDVLYRQEITDISDIHTDQETCERFTKAKNDNGDQFENLYVYRQPLISIEEFDSKNQKNWFVPEEYKKLEIENWLRQQCSNQQEVDRVEQELKLFRQYKMIDLLKFLKYLIDTMRTHNIIWGVGRGSSVSSFCLFLIGVHKINSLKYNLNIEEFLR